jgi:hypothetical protein
VTALPIRFCLLTLLLTLSIATQADAAYLTLAWDPPTDGKTAGYLVFYGTVPGLYTGRIDVGLVTQRRVDGLVEGITYYFAVRAYDSSGRLSGLSAMVAGAAGPSGGVPAGGPVPSSYGRWPGGTAGDVRAVIRANRYIDIAWTPAAGSPHGYRVEVGASAGETDISALTRDHAIAFDMTDVPAAAYFVRIRPLFGTTPGYSSEELVVVPGSPIVGEPGSPAGPAGPCAALPQAPRQFLAASQNTTVSLNWQPGPGEPASAYVLQVGSAPGLPNAVAAQFAATTTSVTATASPAAYALRLAAVNPCGPSVWAPEARLYVGVLPLPGMPLALAGAVTGGVVTLTWQPPATGGPVTQYRIEALTPVGPWVRETGDPETVYTNANTGPGLYLVTVRAGNATGFGPATSPLLLSVPHD